MSESSTPDTINLLIDEGKLTELAEHLRASSERDTVWALERIPRDHAAIAFRLLEKDAAIEVFDALDPAAQADLVSELGHHHLADAFSQLDPDELARLLDELPARVAKRVLREFPPDQLEPVKTVLGYASGTVGREMSPVPLSVRASTTVADALDRVRASDHTIDELAGIPVVGDDGRFIGVAALLDLVRGRPDAPVADVLSDNPLVTHTGDSAEVLARHVLDDLDELFAPVLDREDRVVGTFTALDAARVSRNAVSEDQARAGASEPLGRPYLRTPVLRVAQSRVVWLLVLAVSAVLTVQVLEIFEATLDQVVALALFIPLVTGIGGNTGSQSATTVTRALALGDIRKRDVLRVAFKEVRTGLLLGVVLAVLAFLIASLVYGPAIGAVIGLTIAVNCPIAAMVGGVIPLLATACRVDPAVFSTPFISTFCDASGLLLYFTVARTVLQL
ncbi:magnesium transporter MgtE [Pseudoclavibacter endophyticus]|uniref:Magnesium transporter MgtE n=1 Tax=Pseudoclavibacter endophyticus TaxID=1778590 RepID=A0A6H9WEV1_9MICO|nr:magnesium transporter [Pseudoclavibacter endophyticus]KAB1649442.1 magnesium transporter [Pseudoclavibacter endophyticus]GGA62632.1 magnesium transporter MgtE [Pseudoclavibacter endophyticus]